jgi:hypothetical protein
MRPTHDCSRCWLTAAERGSRADHAVQITVGSRPRTSRERPSRGPVGRHDYYSLATPNLGADGAPNDSLRSLRVPAARPDGDQSTITWFVSSAPAPIRTSDRLPRGAGYIHLVVEWRQFVRVGGRADILALSLSLRPDDPSSGRRTLLSPGHVGPSKTPILSSPIPCRH